MAAASETTAGWTVTVGHNPALVTDDRTLALTTTRAVNEARALAGAGASDEAVLHATSVNDWRGYGTAWVVMVKRKPALVTMNEKQARRHTSAIQKQTEDVCGAILHVIRVNKLCLSLNARERICWADYLAAQSN